MLLLLDDLILFYQIDTPPSMSGLFVILSVLEFSSTFNTAEKLFKLAN